MIGRIRSARLGIFLNVGIGIVFTIAAVIVVISVNDSMHRQALIEAQSKARIILDRNLATHAYFSQIMKPSIFAWSEPFRSKEYFDHTWMSSTYAIREIEKYFKTFNPSGYYFKDASINARSPENEADEYERAFIEKLAIDKKLESESTVRTISGESYLVVLRKGEVMEASCLRCHSNPQNAPKGLTDYYGSERSFYRKAGDAISAVSLHIPLAEAYAAANVFSWKLSGILLSVLMCLFAIQYWLYRRYLLKPLNVMRNKANEIAIHEGHLGEQISQPFGRELTELASAFNEMSVKLRNDRDHLEELVDQRTEALRESEEELQWLFKSMINAFVLFESVFDDDGNFVSYRFVYINDAYKRITGVKTEEVKGKTVHEVWPETEPEWIKSYGEVAVTGASQSFELYHDPTKKLYHCNVYRPWDTKDRFCVIFEDITERKRMEEELLKADKLESVGILAGGIAHDFNNILTSISGNISMVKMQVEPGHKIFDLLSAAEKASVRAQGLTRQLLTFAKGGKPLKETVFFKKLIKESSLFMLQGSKSGCEFQISEDLWPVEADLGQISQVISNIVINANQAMPEGGTIRITAENLMPEEIREIPVKPGRYIRISIKDQGVGIAEQDLSKIFDPYFTTKQAGSGLGLATAYSIIKKHNGHISVNSCPGAGTTFTIYLPASDKGVPVKEEALLLTGRGRILIMDDDEFLKELAKEMLDMLGYESAFAKNGAEAIEMYRKAMESGKPYDAVILDLTIPGSMGGEEVIKILLEIDPEVKAIVFSGYSDGEVMSNFRKYGFKGMMPKPFDTNALGKVLNDVLRDSKSGKET